LLLDRELHFAVEGGGRLVEHQNRGIFQNNPGQGDPLSLAAGELDAALADVGLVAAVAFPVPEAEDEFVRLRLARGRYHVPVACAWPTVADVGRDRAMQERSILRHHADRRAQALLR